MNYLIVITGPTGIGKTNLSIQLAQYFSSEILSADSRQVYKEMEIGTAVPSDEELKKIPHHFIKTVSIHDYYNVSKYESQAIALLEQLYKKHKVVILTGGTGLYIDAVCKGIDLMPDPDPKIRENLNRLFKEKGLDFLQQQLKIKDLEYYQTVDLNNPARIIRALEICEQTQKPYSSFRKTTAKNRDFKTIKIALNTDRSILYDRINRRVHLMIENGLIEEAKSLYTYKDLTALKTVGYQELFSAFSGEYSIEEGITRIQNSSRKYARKQISWIRRDSEYRWFEASQINEIISYIESIIV